LYTTEQWLALYPNRPHWIFDLDNVTHHNLEPDELHIIWLGTAMWFLGSVLRMLVFRILPDTAVANMSKVWSQIAQCYSDMGSSVQYTNLSIASFCDPQKPNGHYPKLKGKGAVVKSLASVLCQVWAMNMQAGNREHALVAQALGAQDGFQCIIEDYAGDLFLPSEKAVAFQQHIIDFLTAYTSLCHMADARGDLLWNMTTKFHWLYHMGSESTFPLPSQGRLLD
jgi:hypothetical protein